MTKFQFLLNKQLLGTDSGKILRHTLTGSSKS